MQKCRVQDLTTVRLKRKPISCARQARSSSIEVSWADGALSLERRANLLQKCDTLAVMLAVARSVFYASLRSHGSPRKTGTKGANVDDYSKPTLLPVDFGLYNDHQNKSQRDIKDERAQCKSHTAASPDPKARSTCLSLCRRVLQEGRLSEGRDPSDLFQRRTPPS